MFSALNSTALGRQGTYYRLRGSQLQERVLFDFAMGCLSAQSAESWQLRKKLRNRSGHGVLLVLVQLRINRQRQHLARRALRLGEISFSVT